MPAEGKRLVNMDEKEFSFSNKEKDGERRPTARDKTKEEVKMSGKKDSGKEEKKKRIEEERKKKEEKERKKKEEEKQKVEEELRKKEEEEKRQQEEQEKKLKEEESKRQREEEAALLKWVTEYKTFLDFSFADTAGTPECIISVLCYSWYFCFC